MLVTPPAPRSIETLIAEVQSSNLFVRDKAARDLGKVGPAAVDPLILLLTDKDKAVRGAAAEALGLIADPRAVAPLIQSMRDPYLGRPSFGEASGALVRIGAPAVAPLIALVHDRDFWASIGAIWALGEIKDPRAVDVLLAVVTTDHTHIVNGRLAYAANALGTIGDPASVPPLIAELKRPPDDGRMGVIAGLAHFGAPAVGPLIAALSSPDANVRRGAADALGRTRYPPDPRAVAVLSDAIAKQNREIVSAAYYYFSNGLCLRITTS